MKLSCTKDNLSQVLSLVGGIAGKNVNLPILGNVLIKADNQNVEIVSTNLELAMVVYLRAKVDEPGQFTVPARTLLDFVNFLSGEKVDLELVNNELVVTCDRATTKIKGSPADDFPVVPQSKDGKGYVVLVEDLKNGLGQVMPALARNDIRPELSGVFCVFNPEGHKGLIMAATDSYRLAEKKIKLEQGEDFFQAIIPGRTAQEIYHLLSTANIDAEKNVRILINENQLVIHYDGAQLVSRLVDGKYPDYTQIIPHAFQTTVNLSLAQLIKEVKTASLFATTGVNAVVFKFNNENTSIASASTQTGEYHSEINTELTGTENNINLNHRYLLDGLNNIKGERVCMKMINADSPCVLISEKDDSYLYIVMPIRQ